MKALERLYGTDSTIVFYAIRYRTKRDDNARQELRREAIALAEIVHNEFVMDQERKLWNESVQRLAEITLVLLPD